MKFKIPSSVKFIQKIKYGTRLSPNRDWLIIISIVFVVLIVGVIWNIFVFFSVVSGPTISSTTPTKNAILDSNAMYKVTQIFEVRHAEQLKYKSGEYTFSDPY